MSKFIEECFTWGLMIRSCKGKLIVKRFKVWVKLVFPLIYPELGYWYITWKINTTTRGFNMKSAFCALCLWGWAFHVKYVFFFKKLLLMTCSLMSWLYGSFRFTYLPARLMEKRVKALHSELEGSWFKPRPLMTLGSSKYQTQW